jgi:hypothetical protein
MDLIRRIRWTNVARAAAVAGVIALIFAWPQLREDPPSLPPEPAVADTPPPPAREFGIEPAPRVRTRAKKTTKASRPRAKRRHRSRRNDGRRRPKPTAPPAPAPTAQPVPRNPIGPPAPAPAAATEFGFE